MASEKTSGHDRTRTWTAVVYPESAPENWRDYLDEEHIEWAESPLHEFDVNPTGEVKKAHWHIVLSFDGPKSYEQVREILAPTNCPAPQKCHSLKGAVRYMAHLDNPEKFQYSVDQIQGHGGFDVASALAPSASQRYALIADMCAYITENHVTEFADFMDYARVERYEDWFPLLCDSAAYVVGQVIKSERHKRQANPEN